MRGRAGRRYRQLGARAHGRAEQMGRAAGRARERQAHRAAGARAAGARGMRGRARRARGRGAAGRAELAGHRRCARSHARPGRGLVHWLGQFGAHAASLGFDLGF